VCVRGGGEHNTQWAAWHGDRRIVSVWCFVSLSRCDGIFRVGIWCNVQINTWNISGRNMVQCTDKSLSRCDVKYFGSEYGANVQINTEQIGGRGFEESGKEK